MPLVMIIHTRCRNKVREKGMRHSLYKVMAFINVRAIFRHDLEIIGRVGPMAPKVLMYHKTRTSTAMLKELAMRTWDKDS
jgi:hypothetical protein